MAGEVFAGLGALKTAFDIAKGLKDIDNATSRNAAVIELQEKLFAARDAQEALLKRISELEKQMADSEAWKTERERYQLTDIGEGTFAYSLKAAMSRSEPAHYICANCYEQSKKSVLHHNISVGGRHALTCSRCNAKMTIGHGYKPPSYSETEQDRKRAALEKCLLCDDGRLKITAVGPDPVFGDMGLQNHELSCDRCGHKENRQHDPHGRLSGGKR